ncbi:D-alanyl-D-alanine carboxypeptidase [Neolewinella persica]|uniref:D-alanyl-D-alanine carboxypeptidase n=1 Tax=Neolewinella persica TaxID=70998 RepID=UPI000376B9A3|nr:D-alanyl-D-alanine carboxypeptidase [Neolewinella persica]
MFSTKRFKNLLQLAASFFLLFWAGTQVQAQQELSGRDTRELQELVEYSEVFAQGHTGFVLYDLDFQTSLYGHNADRHFVPASNVKLLTFYLANKILGHRTPALFYQEYNDHFEVWGTGYPLLMHPSFASFDEAGPWFANQTKPVVLHFPAGEGQDIPRYGAGWSWDDYNDGYVYERSVMPVYGNRLFLDLSPVDAEGRQILMGAPISIAGAIRQVDHQDERIRRSEFGNDFTVNPIFMEASDFPVERPLHLSDQLISNELAATFPQQRISYGQAPYPVSGTFNSLDVSLPDTVFRKLLLNSDNFIAEQLLVQASARRYGRPGITSVIDYAKDTLLPTIGVEDIRWVDGSGLSRYNLMTPRNLARVVMGLDREVGRDRFLSLLPQGGVSGTLEKRFNNKGKPYVWAKTGSLSGVVCLSGLLQTKRGKWLAFSFMHNNFVGSNRGYYDEMEKTLGWCYENL